MSVLTDIQWAVASSLNIGTEAAGLLLSAFLLFGIGLALTLVKKVNPMMTVMVMIAAMGVLTAVAWLPIWVIVVSLIIVSAMFGSKVMEWVGR